MARMSGSASQVEELRILSVFLNFLLTVQKEVLWKVTCSPAASLSGGVLLVTDGLHETNDWLLGVRGLRFGVRNWPQL